MGVGINIFKGEQFTIYSMEWRNVIKKIGYLVKLIPNPLDMPLFVMSHHILLLTAVYGRARRWIYNWKFTYACVVVVGCCCWLPAAGGGDGSGCRRSGKNSKKKLTLFNINCLWNYIKCIFLLLLFLLICYVVMLLFLLRSSASFVHLCVWFFLQ